MHYVSLLIEFLRGRPRAVFWTVTLTQAVLWALVPALFYSAPPGDVPMLLAIGHEFVLGSYLGPPLAFWLGELAYRLGGAFGLYALAQVCIVVAYWAVFTLGRALVGTRHAVLVIVLMVGVSAFTVPTPNFGPGVLAAPLWALALLHYWRAVGERARGNWFLLALDLGLLLLASYIGALLIVLLIVFTLAMGRGRRALYHSEPWLAVVLFGIVVFPHAVWLAKQRDLVLSGLPDSLAMAGKLSPGVWLCLTLAFAHLGLALLIVLATGWPRKRRERAPEIDRAPVAPLARNYVYYFALAPGLAAIAIAFASGTLGPLTSIAPLVVLSTLAVVLAAGDQVRLYRERLLSFAWLGLLFAPPALVVLGLAVLPWTLGTDLRIAQPANVEARFFADNFERRTGKPLKYVTGDVRIAPLVALGAPNRPHVYFAWAPERSPWANPDDFRTQGGLVVWPATGSTAAPPQVLKSQFPELVPEVPRSFTRTIQGVMPLIRLGWAVYRPPAATQ
jgi:hypothetical protein